MDLAYNVLKGKFYDNFNAENQKFLSLLVFEWDRFQYNISNFLCKIGQKIDFLSFSGPYFSLTKSLNHEFLYFYKCLYSKWNI